MNKKYLIVWAIIIGVATILVFTIDWVDLGMKKEIKETIQRQDIQREKATEALKAVESVANELTGLRTDNPFGFEIVDMDGRSANFGIMQYDGVRGERIVEEHMIIFQEVASRENHVLTNNIAEIDSATNKVVAMHRTPTRNYGGEKSPEELEQTARQFVERVYPEFSESTLEFESGSKNGSEETNYFFRWNDKGFALPSGLEMDLPPFVQVGITASGFIFSYDNTIPLYRNLPKEALRAICAFVEIPRTDDSQLHPEKGIVKVWFSEYEPFQNRYLVLPYEPETDFEGCSESAKEWLRHLPNPYDEDKDVSASDDYGFVIPDGWYAHETSGIANKIIILTKTLELPKTSVPIYSHISFSEIETQLAPEEFVDAWGRLGAKSLAEFSGWGVFKEFRVYRILFTEENDSTHITTLFIPMQNGWTVALFTLTPYEAGSERTQTYENIIEQYAERMRFEQKKLDAINANGT